MRLCIDIHSNNHLTLYMEQENGSWSSGLRWLPSVGRNAQDTGSNPVISFFAVFGCFGDYNWTF